MKVKHLSFYFMTHTYKLLSVCARVVNCREFKCYLAPLEHPPNPLHRTPSLFLLFLGMQDHVLSLSLTLCMCFNLFVSVLEFVLNFEPVRHWHLLHSFVIHQLGTPWLCVWSKDVFCVCQIQTETCMRAHLCNKYC